MEQKNKKLTQSDTEDHRETQSGKAEELHIFGIDGHSEIDSDLVHRNITDDILFSAYIHYLDYRFSV